MYCLQEICCNWNNFSFDRKIQRKTAEKVVNK